MTALGLAGSLWVGDKGPWIAILLVVAGVALVVALFFAHREWYTDAVKAVEQGAGLLWPVSVNAHHSHLSVDGDTEIDRASLRPIAEDAGSPLKGQEDKGLLKLAEYMCPRVGAHNLDQRDRDKLEQGRILVRDAIIALAGTPWKRMLFGSAIRAHLHSHKGTTMLYWYIEIAWAYQMGGERFARYPVIEAFVKELKSDEAK